MAHVYRKFICPVPYRGEGWGLPPLSSLRVWGELGRGGADKRTVCGGCHRAARSSEIKPTEQHQVSEDISRGLNTPGRKEEDLGQKLGRSVFCFAE